MRRPRAASTAPTTSYPRAERFWASLALAVSSAIAGPALADTSVPTLHRPTHAPAPPPITIVPGGKPGAPTPPRPHALPPENQHPRLGGKLMRVDPTTAIHLHPHAPHEPCSVDELAKKV